MQSKKLYPDDRSDNQRLGDISFQLNRVANEISSLRELIEAEGQHIVSQDEFNHTVGPKLTDK